MLHSGAGPGKIVGAGAADAAATAAASALHDIVGALPPDAVPAADHSLESSSPGDSSAGVHVHRNRTGATLIDIPPDSSSEDDRTRSRLRARSASVTQRRAVLPAAPRRRVRSANRATSALSVLRETLISGARRVISRGLRTAFTAAGTETPVQSPLRGSAALLFQSVASTASMSTSNRATMSSQPFSNSGGVPGLLERAVRGWQVSSAQRQHLHDNLDTDAANALYRLGAFLVHTCGDSKVMDSRAYRGSKSTSMSNDGIQKLSNERGRRLLPFLAWLPIRIFSTTVMSAALEVWQWVMASCSNLRVLLLSNIVAAWRWSIDMHYGLFSGGTQSSAVTPLGAAPSKGTKAAPDMSSDFLSSPEPDYLSERVARTTLGGSTVYEPPQRLPVGLADHMPHKLMIQVYIYVCVCDIYFLHECLSLLLLAVVRGAVSAEPL